MKDFSLDLIYFGLWVAWLTPKIDIGMVSASFHLVIFGGTMSALGKVSRAE
jgi:hypothetical protein